MLLYFANVDEKYVIQKISGITKSRLLKIGVNKSSVITILEKTMDGMLIKTSEREYFLDNEICKTVVVAKCI